jgi:hypothetical protein
MTSDNMSYAWSFALCVLIVVDAYAGSSSCRIKRCRSKTSRISSLPVR